MDLSDYADPTSLGALPALLIAGVAAWASLAVLRRALRVTYALAVAGAGIGFGKIVAGTDPSGLPAALRPAAENYDAVMVVCVAVSGYLLWRALRPSSLRRR